MSRQANQQPTKFQQVSEFNPGFAARCEELQDRLGYEFENMDLLLEALTHSSYVREASSDAVVTRHNERLEFLGDSVLGLAVSSFLLLENDESSEGLLSRTRASLVNARVLAQIAIKLRVGECLLMSRAEERGGGREKESLLADALEALFGAVYLDAGFLAIEVIIQRLIAEFATNYGEPEQDSKTLLQELTQKLYKVTPSYETLLEAGPAHNMTFQVAVSLGGRVLGTGEGSTKKKAAQAAARIALEHLRQSTEQE